MRKERIFTDVAKVYLYSEIDNWEWSYESLVELMVSEYDSDGIEDLVKDFSEKEQVELFEKYLRLELENFVELDVIATDKMNDTIIKKLSHQVDRINLQE